MRNAKALCAACLEPFGPRALTRRPCPDCKKGYHRACLPTHRLQHRPDPARNFNHRTFTGGAR